jgi:hypothetical protein
MFPWGQRRIKTPAWRRENGILRRLTTTTTTAFRNWRGLGSEGAQHRIDQRQSVVVAGRVVSTRNPELGAQRRIDQRQSVVVAARVVSTRNPGLFFLVLRLLYSWPNVLQLRQPGPKP